MMGIMTLIEAVMPSGLFIPIQRFIIAVSNNMVYPRMFAERHQHPAVIKMERPNNKEAGFEGMQRRSQRLSCGWSSNVSVVI
jgi:hypothetical protein